MLDLCLDTDAAERNVSSVRCSGVCVSRSRKRAGEGGDAYGDGNTVKRVEDVRAWSEAEQELMTQGVTSWVNWDLPVVQMQTVSVGWQTVTFWAAAVKHGSWSYLLARSCWRTQGERMEDQMVLN